MLRTYPWRQRAGALGLVLALTLLAACGGESAAPDGSAGGERSGSGTAPAGEGAPSDGPASDGPAGEGAAGEGGSAMLTLSLPSEPAARCMVPNATTLSRFDSAFAGTAVEADGDGAVLRVERWYTAPRGDLVEVRTGGLAPSEPGLRRFEEGRRYLISGQEGLVSLCGFSGPWSASLERLYERAFPS